MKPTRTFEEPRVLIFIIAYNEEGTIKSVIEDIRMYAPYADIIVVDDCSTDRTEHIARSKGVPVISHLTNSNTAGFAAVKTAMIYASLYGYDICCQVDGDGQHNAAFLSNIIEPIRRDEADFVIGSRFLETQGYTSTKTRIIGIKIFSLITSIIVGQRIYDVTSGFKATGAKIIKLFAQYPHIIHDTNEMIILASLHGARVTEVPVCMNNRKGGKSWYSFSKAILYPLRTLLLILAVVTRRRGA